MIPGASVAEAANVWLSFLATQLNAAVPMLALAPTEQSWIDIIVGEPAPADLFALRANLSSVPLVTEIPYQIAADEKALLAPLLAEVAGRGLPTTSLLNAETVAQNRLGADKWLARFRGGSGRGFLNRLLSPGGTRLARFVVEPASQTQ
jgi:hypothetical protein